MNLIAVTFIVLALTCPIFASPADVELHPLSRQKRQAEFISNSKQLIEDLVANLTTAAQQARDALATFKEGIQIQASKSLEKFQNDLGQLRVRLANAIQSAAERLDNAGAAVRECVEVGKNKSDTIFQDAIQRTKICAQDRLREGRDLINGLASIPDEIRDLVTSVYAEMRNCTLQNSGHVIASGSCLGTVALRGELKGAGLLAQSGLSIARVNLYVSTLPAALEVCAGSGLMTAGLTTAHLLMDIGSCSATSIFTSPQISTLASPFRI